MSKRYNATMTIEVDYYTDVEADSKEQAVQRIKDDWRNLARLCHDRDVVCLVSVHEVEEVESR